MRARVRRASTVQNEAYRPSPGAFQSGGGNAGQPVKRHFALARAGFAAQPGQMILYTVIVAVLFAGALATALLASSVGTRIAGNATGGSIVQNLVLFLLVGALPAGMLVVSMGLLRGTSELDQLFSGYRRPGPVLTIALVHLVAQQTLLFAVLSPGMWLLAKAGLELPENAPVDPEALAEHLPYLFCLMAIALVAHTLAFSYVRARLLLAYPLVISGGLSPLNAMLESVRRTAGQSHYTTVLSSELLFLSGFFVCGFGALFTYGLAYLMLAAAANESLGGSGPGTANVMPSHQNPYSTQ